MSDADRPYIVISSDTHAGARASDYREYLAHEWLDEFDAWAAGFSDGWALVDEDSGDNRFGVSSFLASVNWDSARRAGHLEEQGIAAEVIYPNTVPPFYPSGVITAPGPRDAAEYERRWAGVQAHNRWLADFCAMLPGRRIGLAQVFLDDVGAAIDEARRARASGLMGVLLPPDHFEKLNSWFLPKYDPFWAAVAELGLPVHSHSSIPSNAASSDYGVAGPALGLYESLSLSKRPLAHLLVGGVFERFPSLSFVMTELQCVWVPEVLAGLDGLCDAAKVPGTIPYAFAEAAATQLSRKPSEYFATNCYLATFLSSDDMPAIDQLGCDRVMWGADYPHHEGVWPYSREALRHNLSGRPEAEVRQLTSRTAIELYGLDEEALQRVADEIGPRPSEIARPLAPDELPLDSMCPTFMDARAVFSRIAP